MLTNRSIDHGQSGPARVQTTLPIVHSPNEIEEITPCGSVVTRTGIDPPHWPCVHCADDGAVAPGGPLLLSIGPAGEPRSGIKSECSWDPAGGSDVAQLLGQHEQP